MINTQHNVNPSKRPFPNKVLLFRVFEPFFKTLLQSKTFLKFLSSDTFLVINRLAKRGGRKWEKVGEIVSFESRFYV